MLHLGTAPPFSMEDFFKLCEDLIPGEDLSLLCQSVSNEIFSYDGSNPMLKHWRSYNIALNNELAKIRASRLRLDPEKYLRPDGYTGYELTHLALAAHRNPALIEAERLLDAGRWHFLEELSLGHFFDLEFLLIYAQKLRILERWKKINSANKQAMMEGVLTKG